MVESKAWSAVLCHENDLPDSGAAKAFEVGGRTIAVFHVEEVLYAVDDFCTHSSSSLSKYGKLCGLVVQCALHRARFNITTGEVLRGPTRVPLRRYELHMENGQAHAREAVCVDAPGSGTPYCTSVSAKA